MSAEELVRSTPYGELDVTMTPELMTPELAILALVGAQLSGSGAVLLPSSLARFGAARGVPVWVDVVFVFASFAAGAYLVLSGG